MAARSLVRLLVRNLGEDVAKLRLGASYSRCAPATSSGQLLLQRSHFSALCSSNRIHEPNGAVKSMISAEGNFTARRFRKRKKPSDEEVKEEESDSEDEIEENPMLVDESEDALEEGAKLATVEISSLRLDAVAKSLLAVPRAKIEEAFYKGDIYINGERPTKKSENLSVNDEIDLVLRINPDNHNMLDIKRAQILKVPTHAGEHGKMKVEVRKWQQLTVEMYPDRKA